MKHELKGDVQIADVQVLETVAVEQVAGGVDENLCGKSTTGVGGGGSGGGGGGGGWFQDTFADNIRPW